MDTLDGYCNYSLHSKIHRADCSMLSAGALAIGVSSDYEAAFSLISKSGSTGSEITVARQEYNLAVARNIGPVLQILTCRHNVVSSDLISNLNPAGA